MKTADAIQLAGGTGALAALFGITPSAVSQWGEELPDARYWELRVKQPAWFNQDGSTRLDQSAPPAWDGVERRRACRPAGTVGG